MEATTTLENGTETQAEMTIASKRSKENKEAKMSREDACYDRIDETQLVNVRGHQALQVPWIPYILQPPRRL
jgi:hypothetical protein